MSEETPSAPEPGTITINNATTEVIGVEVSQNPEPEKYQPEKQLEQHVVDKLEQAFCNDMNVLEACLYADISRATFYRHFPEGCEQRERFETLRGTLKLQAKTHVAGLIKGGDKQMLQWWLERRGKDEFSPRVESTGAGGEPLNPGGAAPPVVLTTEEAAKAYADKMREVRPKKDA